MKTSLTEKTSRSFHSIVKSLKISGKKRRKIEKKLFLEKKSKKY